MMYVWDYFDEIPPPKVKSKIVPISFSVNPVKVENPEENEVKPEQHSNFKGRAKEYFAEYCNNSTLHGFKYIGGEVRTIYEKLLWLVFLSVAVVCCFLTVSKTYQKWMSTPVIVSFSENHKSIWEVPFPAITVCPQIKSKQTVCNFTDLAKKAKNKVITEEEEEILQKLLAICELQSSLLETRRDFEDESLFDFFISVAPTLNETIASCEFEDQEFCLNNFSTILTHDGVCFTFNNLANKEMYTTEAYFHKQFIKNNLPSATNWNKEYGYAKVESSKIYPRRLFSAGISGLQMKLQLKEKDLDYLCKYLTEGFKIILHTPGDVPGFHYFLATVNQFVSIAVQPKQITTTDSLRDYEVSQRKCVFQEERKLQFFQRYSHPNCFIECVANHTLASCKCVDYYMPRKKNTPICGANKQECVTEVYNQLMDTQESSPCDCLPSCFYLSYEAESTQISYNDEKISRIYDETLQKNKTNPGVRSTLVFIKFVANEFLPIKRSVLYDNIDFLANCGGILSLFTGFSILSLLEIIYYLTIRIWTNKYRYGKFCMATPSANATSRRIKT